MKKFSIILLLVALIFGAYYMFFIGIIVLKILIGLAILGFIGLGILIGYTIGYAIAHKKFTT